MVVDMTTAASPTTRPTDPLIPTSGRALLNKVPEITIWFWVIKILCTTVGESFADWIAVDWGTSRLRVWAMRGDQPVAGSSSDKGMSALSRDGFEPALLDLIEPWLGRDRM